MVKTPSPSCSNRCEDDPRIYRNSFPDVPAEISSFVGRCLSKRIEDRFADAGAMLQALRALDVKPAPVKTGARHGGAGSRAPLRRAGTVRRGGDSPRRSASGAARRLGSHPRGGGRSKGGRCAVFQSSFREDAAGGRGRSGSCAKGARAAPAPAPLQERQDLPAIAAGERARLLGGA